MAAGDISTLFSDNPWGDLSMLERYPTYVPDLLATYKRACKWNRFVGTQINFSALTSRQMVLTRQLHGRPDFSAKSSKTLLFPVSTFIGLQRKTIALEYHYDKIQWHDDDQLWNFTNVPLETLSRNELGWNMAQYFDYLARKAAMDSAYNKYPTSAITGFDGLTSATDHLFQLPWISEILLGMEYEHIVDSETGMPSVACMTSPGVIYDISTMAGGEWRALNSFTDSGRAALMAYGIQGVYKGIGFIPSTAQTLWCAGAIDTQVAIVEPVNTLDGVADAADAQGWNGAQDGIKNYVQCVSGADLSGISAGDVVVLHRTRVATHGVTNGVDPNEGKADYKIVASVDDANDRIAFTEPWMKDGYTTPLAAGNYGYLTKAEHVHMSSFIADSGAIQMGVAQAPKLNKGVSLDDMGKMHRVAWDFHGAVTMMNHQGLRNVYTRGSVVVPGSMVVTV